MKEEQKRNEEKRKKETKLLEDLQAINPGLRTGSRLNLIPTDIHRTLSSVTLTLDKVQAETDIVKGKDKEREKKMEGDIGKLREQLLLKVLLCEVDFHEIRKKNMVMTSTS